MVFFSKDPQERLIYAYSAVLLVAGLSLIVGLIAVLFEVEILQRMGHGYASIFSGAGLLVLGYFIKRASMVALAIAILAYSADTLVFLAGFFNEGSPPIGGILFRLFTMVAMIQGVGAIRQLTESQKQESTNPQSPVFTSTDSIRLRPVAHASRPPSARTILPGEPKAVSFVAPAPVSFQDLPATPVQAARPAAQEVASGAIRFVAYRMEIGTDSICAVYSNGSRIDVPWSQITALMIRQLPLNPPWEGKLMLDVIPVVTAGASQRPVRMLSTTYVNYSSLPQGQASSARENIRRLCLFMTAQNPSIFLEEGTDAFLRSGLPPVRFTGIAQFSEYDSRYS